MDTRLEHDLLGHMAVPGDAYYGIHSLRSAATFQLSGLRIHQSLIKALADVKFACAEANRQTGYLEDDITEAIQKACDRIASGELDHQFIVDAFQGGAGTSSNMNANEVIANAALEMMGFSKGDYSHIHPLDHVNLSQSTNDVFPTAVKVAAIRLLLPAIDAMSALQAALQQKEAEFAGVIKVGRTEMQDAVPITLGQEFAAWAQAVQRDWWRLYKVEERLRQVNLGGTAVGTGLNADREYVFSVVRCLRERTGLNISRAENMIDATQNCDVFVEVSGMLKSAAVNLHKISSDLRLLSSGPRAGLGEITLPPLQAGSSIMPGKVNPTATEAVSQAAFQIMANDQAITLCAMNGQLELNAFLPLLAHNLFQSMELLKGAAELLSNQCISGIKANVAACAKHIEDSFALLTALSPYVGYERASAIALEAQETGRTVRQIAAQSGEFSSEQLARILDAVEMTKPGIAGLDQD